MKIPEAIRLLEQMDVNTEVELTFHIKVTDRFGPRTKKWTPASDHPCGGAYESQHEKFGG
jgi:hypothetical protein